MNARNLVNFKFDFDSKSIAKKFQLAVRSSMEMGVLNES